MQRVIPTVLAAGILAAGMLCPAAAAQEGRREIVVSVPAAVVAAPVVSAVNEACRLLAAKKLSESAAALRRAAEGTESASLRKSLTAAADALLAAADPSAGTPVSGDLGKEPLFVLPPGKKDEPRRGCLCLPLPREDVWLTTYLEDPSRLRPDLPENLPGESADIAALPPVRMVDLIAAAAPESLSAWFAGSAGSGVVLVFRNLISAYCRDHLSKAAKKALAAAWAPRVDAKALEWLVAMHRVAHGMGPLAVEDAAGAQMVSVASRLEGASQLLEAIKADGLALLAGLRLAGEKKDFGPSVAQLTATYVIFLMDRAFSSAGKQAVAFRTVFLLLVADGAVRLDLKSGRVLPDPQRLRDSMKKLLARVIRVQGSGSLAEAESILAPGKRTIDKNDPFAALMPEGVSAFSLVGPAADVSGTK